VDDLHVACVRVVQAAVRGQRPRLEQERRWVQSSKSVQNYIASPLSRFT
jgi:hypothetical protein